MFGGGCIICLKQNMTEAEMRGKVSKSLSNGILLLGNLTAVYFLLGATANEDISSAVLHFPEGIISFLTATASSSSAAILTAKRA